MRRGLVAYNRFDRRDDLRLLLPLSFLTTPTFYLAAAYNKTAQWPLITYDADRSVVAVLVMPLHARAFGHRGEYTVRRLSDGQITLRWRGVMRNYDQTSALRRDGIRI